MCPDSVFMSFFSAWTKVNNEMDSCARSQREGIKKNFIFLFRTVTYLGLCTPLKMFLFYYSGGPIVYKDKNPNNPTLASK